MKRRKEDGDSTFGASSTSMWILASFEQKALHNDDHPAFPFEIRFCDFEAHNIQGEINSANALGDVLVPKPKRPGK